MECKNYWCAHWDYNKCLIEGNIVIDDNGQSKAVWIDINEFKNGNKILYPEEVFKYI